MFPVSQHYKLIPSKPPNYSAINYPKYIKPDDVEGAVMVRLFGKLMKKLNGHAEDLGNIVESLVVYLPNSSKIRLF